MNFTLKDITVDDHIEIANLYAEAYNKSNWDESWAMETAYSRIKELFSSEYAKGIGCLHKNTIIGVIVFELSTWDVGKQCEIKEVFVNPSFRRKGIGKKLIQAVEQWCENYYVNRISLWTTNSEELVMFYSKLGYSKNDSIIQMAKRR